MNPGHLGDLTLPPFAHYLARVLFGGFRIRRACWTTAHDTIAYRMVETRPDFPSFGGTAEYWQSRGVHGSVHHVGVGEQRQRK